MHRIDGTERWSHTTLRPPVMGNWILCLKIRVELWDRNRDLWIHGRLVNNSTPGWRSLAPLSVINPLVHFIPINFFKVCTYRLMFSDLHVNNNLKLFQIFLQLMISKSFVRFWKLQRFSGSTVLPYSFYYLFIHVS